MLPGLIQAYKEHEAIETFAAFKKAYKAGLNPGGTNEGEVSDIIPRRKQETDSLKCIRFQDCCEYSRAGVPSKSYQLQEC